MNQVETGTSRGSVREDVPGSTTVWGWDIRKSSCQVKIRDVVNHDSSVRENTLETRSVLPSVPGTGVVPQYTELLK